MRKQTKVVAVASAAALLAIGASMTSFAASGWVEEDGVWYWYDNDGNKVEDVWKKSGDNWYWLDGEEDGAMAVDKLIEDDDDIYYVDGNGAMVKNTWVKVVNEDQDEDEDPAEYHYYYMQANGKAYKAPDNSSSIRFRTIDGKRYAFDDDGIMLYGWVSSDGERQTDDDGWEGATYYLGSWEDGAMKTGWQLIEVYDGEEDDDVEHYFSFKSNGKKRDNESTDQDKIKEVKINGKKYGFDYRGVMVSQWTLTTSTNVASSASNWRYFSSPEDGARVSKGWFKVVAPDEDNDNVFKSTYGSATFAATDASDETERWYYADGDGLLYEGAIKKIKGKYYGFRPDDDANGKGAAMLNGLVLMDVNTSNGDIIKVLDDNVESDELDHLIDWDLTSEIVDKVVSYTPVGTVSLYYFGNDEDTDGAMKTGNVTVNLDGDSYNFLFSKTGGAESRGRGLTGVDDNDYIYRYGCRIKADSDDKYQVVKVTGTGSVDVNSNNASVEKTESLELKRWAQSDNPAHGGGHFVNDDDTTVYYVDMTKGVDPTTTHWYLVNTSGKIQKSASAKKDGDDWYFYVKNRAIMLYSNDKNLDEKNNDQVEKWEDLVSNLNLKN